MLDVKTWMAAALVAALLLLAYLHGDNKVLTASLAASKAEVTRLTTQNRELAQKLSTAREETSECRTALANLSSEVSAQAVASVSDQQQAAQRVDSTLSALPAQIRKDRSVPASQANQWMEDLFK